MGTPLAGWGSGARNRRQLETVERRLDSPTPLTEGGHADLAPDPHHRSRCAGPRRLLWPGTQVGRSAHRRPDPQRFPKRVVRRRKAAARLASVYRRIRDSTHRRPDPRQIPDASRSDARPRRRRDRSRGITAAHYAEPLSSYSRRPGLTPVGSASAWRPPGAVTPQRHAAAAASKRSWVRADSPGCGRSTRRARLCTACRGSSTRRTQVRS